MVCPPVLILRHCVRLPIPGPSMMPDLRQGKLWAISGTSLVGLSGRMKKLTDLSESVVSRSLPAAACLHSARHGIQHHICSKQGRIGATEAANASSFSGGHSPPNGGSSGPTGATKSGSDTRATKKHRILPVPQMRSGSPCRAGRYLSRCYPLRPRTNSGRKVSPLGSAACFCTHSPVARTFFVAQFVCAHSHIFMRVHMHAWLKCLKRFNAHVSHLSISLSPFS